MTRTLTTRVGLTLPTQLLQNAHLQLEFLAQAGPRVVRLALAGDSDNLLAETPDFKIPTTYGDFSFHGGHRLWHAPEALPRTYLPDDAGLQVEPLPDGARLSGANDPITGIRKQIEIRLQADRAAATLHHQLTNTGLWPIELAPWAITQFPLGGWGVLPQPREETGFAPNRTLALWPYSRWTDPRLHWRDDYLLFQAEALLPPFKLGYRNTHGWLGYWRAGVFFVKRFEPFAPHHTYPDLNSNTEMYCNDLSFELETLAPLARLEPGATVKHTEMWEVYRAETWEEGVEKLSTD